MARVVGRGSNVHCLLGHPRQWNASCSHHDALFQLLYPHIVHDLTGGRLPSCFGTESHQKEIWDGLPSNIGIVKQGFQMKMSRWFNFISKTEVFKPYWSTVLAVLLYFGLFKGWFKNKEELPFLQALPAGEPAANGRAGTKHA